MSRSVHAYLTLKEVLRSSLFWLVILTGVMWYLLHLATVHNMDGDFDPSTLVLISVAYTVNAVIMAVRTGSGPWSILGAGLLATFCGDALFYFYIFAGTERIQIPHREAGLDLVRALFVIGGIFTLLGHLREWWRDDGSAARALKRFLRKDNS